MNDGSDWRGSTKARTAEEVRPGKGQLPTDDLVAVLGELDRATRNLTRHLEGGEGTLRATPTPPKRPASAYPRLGADPFEARRREAELEAREYLKGAKRRADIIVAAMVAALEQEVAAIRRDAEEGIRSRWSQVEAEAQRHLEEAHRVGDGMLAERQHRLAVLSDGITSRAEAVSSGLEDADRVRGQFEAFVRALSDTAERIAREAASGGSRRAPAEFRDLPRNSPPGEIAA